MATGQLRYTISRAGNRGGRRRLIAGQLRGRGGSILAMPILTYAVGAKETIASSLAVVKIGERPE